ncbi:MAG: diphosphomevalonate decarboxylase [Chloroflexi bacterium]|nr:diphosphomevalonate decarboxylase [Chloroflexota bacterium]MCC6891323.1 diphosphomevalonate decarboxylase [Anaerolineae bacterium]
MTQEATARAHPNIAFIKYWGNQDEQLRIPVNSSLSMNLEGLYTETMVNWDHRLTQDSLIINSVEQSGDALKRVQTHLSALRNHIDGIEGHAKVISYNNFPMGVGIASSASSFAALTLAAVSASGQQLSESTLSSLARLGSGSASRSIPTGFVEWHKGVSHETSYAESIATPDFWDLVDVIAVVSNTHKKVGSTEGHQSANTSDLQLARIANAEKRLQDCKEALLHKDFHSFATVVEEDSNLMHSIMMTSRPPLFYWQPTSIELMHLIPEWRHEGLDVCYTLDAGPNVHCICNRIHAEEVSRRVRNISGVLDVKSAGAGRGAYLL